MIRYAPNMALALALCLHTVRGATITGMDPTLGPPGTQVQVTGSSLLGTTNVLMGEVPADFSVLAHDRLLVIVPPLPMTGPLRVGTTAGSAVSAGSFLAPPRITGFAPVRSGTNTTVTLEGANFTGATAVRFNGTNAPGFTVTAPTQIQVKVPAGASTGPIEVTAPGGVALSAVPFTVSGPAPIVDDLVPGLGAPGSQVRIEGVNFLGATSVKFNNVAAAFTVTAETQISATVPGTATTGPVAVTTAKGTGTSAGSFVVTRAPVITNFLPAIGVGGTSVTLGGVNFSNVTGISFNGRAATGFGTPAPGQLNVTVPSGATTGPIRVTNSFGVGVSAANFIVTAAPLMADFAPEVGAPGTIVTINGVNFSGTTAVSYNGRAAAFSITAPTQLRTTVPAGATTGPIVIQNASGACTSAVPFVVIGSAPFVSDFAPARGPRGTTVIITGQNFTNVTAVTFNGTNAASFVATAMSQIHAVVPAQATTGPIKVTTTAGSFVTTNDFHVPPRLTRLDPVSAFVGDTVTISGTNLAATLSLQVGGVGWDFSVADAGTLRATVPTQAMDGLVIVETPGGSLISTSGFLLLPRLTSVAPVLGSPGTTVILRGTGLGRATAVRFGGVAATFQVLASTEIRAEVPVGAQTGFIEVQTTNGVASSPSVFTVTGASDLALSTTVTPWMVQPGGTVKFRVTLVNRGPAVVSALRFTNTLPAGLTPVSVTASAGALTISGRVSALGMDTFDSGAVAVIDVTTIAPSEGSYTNTSTVVAAEQDLLASNNLSVGVVAVITDAARLLRIRPLPGGSVVVSWPTSALPFVVQSTTNLGAGFSGSVLPGVPVLTGGEFRLTNAAPGVGGFYRLRY